MKASLRALALGFVWVVAGECAARGQGASERKDKREEAEWAAMFEYLARSIKSDVPRSGCVPDSKTALVIGEAIARVVNGDAVISREKPLRARLKNGIWTVMGTLNPPGALGGVAIIQLRKSDGQVIRATHTY